LLLGKEFEMSVLLIAMTCVAAVACAATIAVFAVLMVVARSYDDGDR
jgi:hypothetical protein